MMTSPAAGGVDARLQGREGVDLVAVGGGTGRRGKAQQQKEQDAPAAHSVHYVRIALMDRRDALKSLVALFASSPVLAAESVSTLIGTGSAGYSDGQVNNPYGLVIGPDGALYFCDLDNQRIRRLDLRTRRTVTVAGNGQRAYAGDGGPATDAALNMPHEIQFDSAGHFYIAERDNHVIRKVDARTGLISTFAGTGRPGFGGDGGPAAKAELRQPHSIAVDPSRRFLLVCDVGNHRIRRVEFATGVIDTFAGTGERLPTADGAPLKGTPLNGPRTMAFDAAGDLYLALREGNAIYRVDGKSSTFRHVAGTGEQGYSGDGGPARLARLAGPKGLAWSRDSLYVVDTENHVIRAIDLKTGIIRTVLGTGQRGDGPEPDPLRCALARPHGVFVDSRGVLYVGDSEAHRIRTLGCRDGRGGCRHRLSSVWRKPRPVPAATSSRRRTAPGTCAVGRRRSALPSATARRRAGPAGVRQRGDARQTRMTSASCTRSKGSMARASGRSVDSSTTSGGSPPATIATGAQPLDLVVDTSIVMRPPGASVAIRSSAPLKSRKLPGQRASGDVAKSRKRSRASRLNDTRTAGRRATQSASS